MNDPEVQTLHQFVRKVQFQLGANHLVKHAIFFLFCASLFSVVVGLSYVLQGFKVDVSTLLLVNSCTVACFVVYVWATYPSRDEAIEIAEQQFDLKDGLVSSLSFKQQEKTGEVYDLQLSHTAKLLQQIQDVKILYELPKKILLASILFVMTSLYLTSLDDSDEVKNAQLAAQENLAKSEEINQFLKEKMEELEKAMSEEEKKMFKKSQIKKLVEDLKATKDMKEALKTYAKIEQKLQESQKAHSIKKEEKTLKELAKQLKQRDATKHLGKKLESKQYKQVSKDFKKLAEKDKTYKKENKKNIEEMKELGKAMSMNNSSSKSMDPFEALSKSISDASLELAEFYEEADMQFKQGQVGQECKNKLGQAGDKFKGEMVQFSKKLSELNVKKTFLAKCDSLKQSLGMCQSTMAGNKPGGLNPGQSTAQNDRTDLGPAVSNRLDTQLKGQKGVGPSRISIEEAESGSAVSSAVSSKKTVQYQHSMESFIQREDIPDSLKDGVKNYFEKIHGISKAE